MDKMFPDKMFPDKMFPDTIFSDPEVQCISIETCFLTQFAVNASSLEI